MLKTRKSPSKIHAIMRVQNPVVPLERIERAIFFLRGHKVMLSTHLAELYEVEPRALAQAVKRNIERFPPDFIFQLSKVEFKNLKSQIVTSNWGGLRRAAPYAFTEQGVAMLSGRSKKEQLALSFSEALTRAERDIKQNWSVYRERFLKGEWP